MYGKTTLVAPMMLQVANDWSKEICIRALTERRAHFTSKVPKAIEEAAREERHEVGRQAGEEGGHKVQQHRNHQHALAAARVRQRTPHVRPENHSCQSTTIGGKSKKYDEEIYQKFIGHAYINFKWFCVGRYFFRQNSHFTDLTCMERIKKFR